MSRLHFDNLSGLLSIELVTAATVPGAGQNGLDGSFEQHLEQARRTVEKRTGAERSPSADRSSDTERRQAARKAPSDSGRQADTAQAASDSRQDDPSTADASRSDSGGQADADNAQSHDPRAEGVSDADEARDTQSEPGDGDSDDESPQMADALAVIVAVKLGDQENVADTSLVSGEETAASEGQSQAEKPAQQTTFSDTVGELVLGEMELEDAEAASSEDAIAAAEADGEEGLQPPHGQIVGDRIAQQSQGPSDGEQNSGKAASEGTEGSTGDPTGPASEAGEAAADSHHKWGGQHGGSLLAESAGENAFAQSAEDVASQATQHAASAASQTEPPDEIGSEGGGAPSAVSTPTDARGGETAMTTRVGSNPPIRQTSSGSAQGGSGVDQTDRVRFVQRVARAFEAMGDRGGSVRLRLHPPELGSLRLEVAVRNGTMNARLEVETDSARTMLLDSLPALRDRLAEQDIKVGRFDVDLGDRSSGGTPQGPGDQPQPRDDSDRGSFRRAAPPEVEGEGPPESRPTVQPGQGSQLDVVI